MGPDPHGDSGRRWDPDTWPAGGADPAPQPAWPGVQPAQPAWPGVQPAQPAWPGGQTVQQQPDPDAAPFWQPRVEAGGPVPPGPPPTPGGRRGRGRIVVAVAAVLTLLAGAVTAAFTVPALGVALGLRPGPRELATRAGTQFLAAWQAGNYPAMQALVLSSGDDMARAYGGMVERLKITRTVVTPGALDQAGTALPYTATVTLKGLGDVSWGSLVQLQETPAGWRVRFTSTAVHPDLANGQRLQLTTATTTRGALLDRTGEPLGNDADLSANVVGKAGKNGTGATGLQRAFNATLAGTPTTRLVVADAASGKTVSVVKEWGATPGQDVRTTVDLSMQRAAERALSAVAGRAALVAIDTTTGEVRAMASHPTSGLATAFASYYAPGSTFKIITATAALMSGATPQSPVQCTPTVSVDGRTFKNAENAPARTLTLAEAFAESCNTAFIRLSRTLPSGALQAAAKLYGFDGSKPLPIASVGGQLPPPASSVEAAADAIGQGKVEASPLQMASVAAAVASGTWRQPHLVTDCPDCASHAVPVASGLQPMMRAVVTSGTGTAAQNVAGGPVYAKTGTAEFGSASPPLTHAWFVGWQGSTAFAVFVEEGAFGGTVAAPIAAKFLAYSAVG